LHHTEEIIFCLEPFVLQSQSNPTNQQNSMDVILLSDTIDEILARTIPSLETTTSLPIGLSKNDIEKLTVPLQKFQAVVKKHVQGGQEVSLRIIKTAVNDLNDFLEELASLRLLKHDQQKTRIKAVNSKNLTFIEGIQRVASELPTTTSTSTPSQEAWEKIAKTTLDPAGVGRKKEMKEIIDQLMSLHTKTGASGVALPIPVVTIVGFEGIGKTKLLSLICEAEQVKTHFGQPIWVHKLESVESIAGALLTDQKSITDAPLTNQKGYLVVIDDWKTGDILSDDEKLSKLQEILTESGGESAILITTHSKHVANSINTTIRSKNIASNANSFTYFKPHVLKGLNEEESWSLFQSICGNDIKVEEMEKKIMKDCGGIPFWIILTAELTKYQRGVTEENANVLKENFLKILKLIYYNKFPRLQKMCFSFCSLFPRDHLIDVGRLIRLWKAEGFLVEENLRQYFNYFVERPIFKDMEEDECGVVRRCRMQPLMHDLARFVSDQEENVMIDPEGEKVHEGVLRASFDFSLDASRGIPPSLFEKAKKLRAILLWKTQTLLPKDMTSTCDQILKTFKTTLRMLDLHDSGIKILASSIGEMKNLRYLDLSLNPIEKLPSSIIKLSNLQTLKLSQCYHLKELPKNIEELVSLNHLEIDECFALIHIPNKMNKLAKSLQTLSLFVVSEWHHLGDLASLNNLRDHLEISHLEKSNLLGRENQSYLTEKEHLQSLALRWYHDDDSDEENSKDLKTLDCLKPHSKLRAIFLVGYKSTSLSTWFSEVQCLVKLSLYDCTNCTFLPKLDELPNLKFLELLRLDNLQYIAEENGDRSDRGKQASGVYFPSLEELTITDCPNLKGWWEMDKTGEDLPSFACLSKLNLYYCPQLICMPLFPGLDEDLVLVGSRVKPLQVTIDHGKVRCNPLSRLKSMKIASIEQESHQPQPEEWIKCFKSLEKLDIKEWKHLESLPKGFHHLTSLENLNIENCRELDLSSTEWEGLKSLRSLTIKENPKLKTLPLSIYKATSLQDLQLHNCPQMTSLSETIDNLKSLEKLVISECDKLASLPKALKNVESLHTLIILDCPLLLPRCQPDTGDDWPQIKHIKNKQVTA